MLKSLVGAAIATAFLSTQALADEAAIKGRQSLMGLYNFNAGILFGMAQEKMEYDADAASAAASNLLAASQINQMSMWPQGTDATAMPGKTRAKSELWATFPAVFDNAIALTKAAEATVAAAGGGLESLQGAIPALGKACGACHKAYRAPKS